MIDLPSCVMQACVTIAPKGLSANFEINFPVCKSQIPTQSLVTVAAKLQSSARLLIQIEDRTNYVKILLPIKKNIRYLIMSICNSCLSIT